MGLSKKVYRALEDIVGSENIDDRQFVLAAYRHTSPQSGRKQKSPSAVVMPGNTDEVQRIIRVCNEYKVVFNTITSLFGVSALPEVIKSFTGKTWQ